MFQKSIKLCCFGSFSISHRGHSLLNGLFSPFLAEGANSFQRKFSTYGSNLVENTMTAVEENQFSSTSSAGEAGKPVESNESFWFHRLTIPSNVKVSHSILSTNSFDSAGSPAKLRLVGSSVAGVFQGGVKLSNSEAQLPNKNSEEVESHQNGIQTPSTLLHFRGPLGSLEINLQKIDTYGLSFFKLHKSRHGGEDEVFLDFFVKKLSTKKTARFLPNSTTHRGVGQDSSVLNGKIHHSKDTLCMLGSLVSLCRNAIEGVSFGFVVYLELLGVGYKASIHKNADKDEFLEVKVGQSHDILYPLPQSIKAFVIKPTLIGLYSIDKTELKQIAAEIRSIKPPEPYKGKGIRFKDEVLITKIGKKK